MNTRKSATERQEHVMETLMQKDYLTILKLVEVGGDFQQVIMLYKNNITDDSKAPGNNTEVTMYYLYTVIGLEDQINFCIIQKQIN